MGIVFQYGIMKKFWKARALLVTQHCECTERQGSIHLQKAKAVNSVLCVLHHKKKKKEKKPQQ